MSTRSLAPLAVLLAIALVLPAALAPQARADEPGAVPARPDLPALASDEEAEAAIDAFKEAFKARGLRGPDKTSQRDWAMSELAKVQHPDVVDELFKVTRNRDDTLRTLAVIYLGEQRALPVYAGEKILRAMDRNDDNLVLVMSALQALGELEYLGGGEEIADLLRHPDYAIKKAAIAAIGETGDLRLLDEVLKIVGIEWTPGQDTGGDGGDANSGSSGGEEVVEEGYSWDGVEVEYDTGTAGDGDQKMAEKIGKEQLAKNKAEAQAGARGSGGNPGSSVSPGGSGSGGNRGSGGASRTTEELLPAILRTLHQLTGEKFDSPRMIRAWTRANDEALEARMKLLDEIEEAMAKDPKREDEQD